MRLKEKLTAIDREKRERYKTLEIKLPEARTKQREYEDSLREAGKSYWEIDKDWQVGNLRSDTKSIEKELEVLKKEISAIHGILTNAPKVIVVDRESLAKNQSWFNDKTITINGLSGEFNSYSSLSANLNGRMSGSSFLGFGSISGYVDGHASGQAKANGKDNVLLTWQYNLDYEIDEMFFDIKSYVGGE